MRDKAVSKCLVCKKREDSLRRGLCNAHYQRFIRQCRKLTDEAREEFEQELIEKQLLLPSKVGGRPSEHSDPFAAIAEKYEKKKTFEEQVADDIEQVNQNLDEALKDIEKEGQNPKPTKQRRKKSG